MLLNASLNSFYLGKNIIDGNENEFNDLMAIKWNNYCGNNYSGGVKLV